MTTITFEQLDQTLDSLSFDDHLLLMERLAKRIRTYKMRQRFKTDLALEAMANDPDVQRERSIDPQDLLQNQLVQSPIEQWVRLKMHYVIV